MNHQSIHTEAVAVVARYKKCEIDLIEVLEKVWINRTFHQYECNSLFQYAVKRLKLSPEVTNIYNKIMKKTLKVSGFKDEIRSGNITISNASRICSVITEDNKAKSQSGSLKKKLRRLRQDQRSEKRPRSKTAGASSGTRSPLEFLRSIFKICSGPLICSVSSLDEQQHWKISP